MDEIFAYLNFRTPKKRLEMIGILIQGLEGIEYRGYGSAGLAIDGGSNKDSPHGETFLLRREVKVSVLAGSVQKLDGLDMVYENHCEVAHTRWATHGAPQDVNSHPQRSNDSSDFVVVHNGIITNYREIREDLLKEGHKFESETDTEVIAKLTQDIHDRFPGNFTII